MPFYRDSKTLYTVIRATFTRLVTESPDHLDGLKSLVEARLVLQLKTTAPEAEITLNARDKRFQAIYGNSTVRPDLIVEMTADTFHRILLDELSIKKAWSGGQIKVKGPIWRLKVLSDLVQGARAFYPGVLQEQLAPPRPVTPSTSFKKAGH